MGTGKFGLSTDAEHPLKALTLDKHLFWMEAWHGRIEKPPRRAKIEEVWEAVSSEEGIRDQTSFHDGEPFP